MSPFLSWNTVLTTNLFSAISLPPAAERNGDDGARCLLPQLSHICLGRPFLALVEGNAGNIIHDQIIIRDAFFVQVVNEPALFQIAPRGSAEVAVTRCRPLTCVVGFAADIPPFFTHSLDVYKRQAAGGAQ